MTIENVASNWSFAGQWYYDRKNATIGYIPRAGETVAQLEASATTSTVEELLVVNGTKNIKWEGVHFAFATWNGACCIQMPFVHIDAIYDMDISLISERTYRQLGQLGLCRHPVWIPLSARRTACQCPRMELDKRYLQRV